MDLIYSESNVNGEFANHEVVSGLNPGGYGSVQGIDPLGVPIDSASRLQTIGAIVGDRRYGDLLSDAPRVALHAGWLAWGSDTGLEPVRVSIPPAADFWSLCPRTLQLPESWPTRLGFAGESV